MRKIISKHQREKKERTKQIVVGGILVIIMFASVIGYAFQGKNVEEDSKIKYNNFEFIKKDGSWIFQEFIFKYNPKETEEFESNEFINLLIDYQNQPLYIYSEDKEAESEIYRNLIKSAERIQYACLENEFECEETWPIKTCEDNFILIKEGDFKIEQKDNCLIIQGKKEDLVKLSDETLFKILSIK